LLLTHHDRAPSVLDNSVTGATSSALKYDVADGLRHIGLDVFADQVARLNAARALIAA
jgi:hypothetical protein